MAALICSHHLRNVDAGLAEGHVGLDVGEGGTGDVDGGGHDIAAIEDFFHHHRMEGGQVSTGTLVAGGHLLVDGGEERTGTAGEIADAKAADGLGVGPE